MRLDTKGKKILFPLKRDILSLKKMLSVPNCGRVLCCFWHSCFFTLDNWHPAMHSRQDRKWELTPFFSCVYPTHCFLWSNRVMVLQWGNSTLQECKELSEVWEVFHLNKQTCCLFFEKNWMSFLLLAIQNSHSPHAFWCIGSAILFTLVRPK